VLFDSLFSFITFIFGDVIVIVDVDDIGIGVVVYIFVYIIIRLYYTIFL
jgi:hypothetical protein